MIRFRDVPYWVLVGLTVLLLFMAAMHKAAADEQQIRRDCRRDAVRYCTGEAAKCAVKETPQCRGAVIACMLSNRDKLQEKCSRHLR